MKKLLFLFLSLFINNFAIACKCPEIQPITKAFCNNYDIIFYGQIDSITKSKDSNLNVAHFKVITLFKGKLTSNVKINYDAVSSCMMSLAPQEHWLIYAYYEKYDFLTISICQHSRKRFSEESLDYFQINAKRTFDEEKRFLIDSLGVQSFIEDNNRQEIQQNQISQRNIQPKPMNKLFLLLISLASMGIIFYLIRKNK
jgi:hypothetical protein